MRSSSLVLLCILVIYIITTNGVSGLRMSRRRTRCPNASLLLVKKRVGRRNQKGGSCRLQRRGGDTCLSKGLACCENYFGDYVCVTKRQRRRKVAHLEAPPANEFSNVMQHDADTVQSPNCPQPDKRCNPVSGQCAVGCPGYLGDGYINCTETRICVEGRICCIDPCDYGKEQQNRLCFPDESEIAMTTADQLGEEELAAVASDERCPTSENICELMACDLLSCPEYNDSANNLCQSNAHCRDEGVCCPAVCAGSPSEKRCHPPKKPLQEQPIPEAPRLAPMDEGLTDDVSDIPDSACPAPIYEERVDEATQRVVKVPACVGYVNIEECSESGVCPDGLICCQDPCALVQEPAVGASVTEPLRFCFEPVVQNEMAESAGAVVIENAILECPSKEETCSRLDCDNDLCPKYDESYTTCSANTSCTQSMQICCPSQCGDGGMLCHPAKEFEAHSSTSRVEEAIVEGTVEEELFVCLRPIQHGCIAWAATPGQPGTGVCTETTDCAEDRLCCELDKCDGGKYCSRKFNRSSLLNPDCPIPFYTLPNDLNNQVLEEGECEPSGCPDGEICCAMSVLGDRMCVDPQ